MPDQKFTGQRLDDTGLYYNNARYYDASIGRFRLSRERGRHFVIGTRRGGKRRLDTNVLTSSEV
jgi:uncharacterized protein RhaS with RHS repeats